MTLIKSTTSINILLTILLLFTSTLTQAEANNNAEEITSQKANNQLEKKVPTLTPDELKLYQQLNGHSDTKDLIKTNKGKKSTGKKHKNMTTQQNFGNGYGSGYGSRQKHY